MTSQSAIVDRIAVQNHGSWKILRILFIGVLIINFVHKMHKTFKTEAKFQVCMQFGKTIGLLSVPQFPEMISTKSFVKGFNKSLCNLLYDFVKKGV